MNLNNNYEILNEFSGPTQSRGVLAEMTISRQAQEVQAAMVIAKRFPRDEAAAFNRIMKSCERKSLAEQSMYEYPRGGQKVTGPSIRLAEAIAQNWGNLDFGVLELEQRNGESVVMAYAWDLETNTRQTKTFTVRHIRDTKQGSKALTESRDVYEISANQGARRVRACILGVIPGDVVDAAIKQCEKTLAGDNKTPLSDTIRDMIVVFEREHQVTKEMLEKYIGCKYDAFTRNDVLRLAKVSKSLTDGMAVCEQFFDTGEGESSVKADNAETSKAKNQNGNEQNNHISMNDL
jgi:hypothetical protein